MIYSSSSPAEKGEAFYSILQDKNQENIAASDKDFPETFRIIIDLAIKLVNEYETKVSGKD